MSNETTLKIVGNLTADPELKYSASGAAVVNFTVASTPRIFDRQANDWKDGPALFMRCVAWRDLAENIAESLTKGMRVIVDGRLTQRSYEDREGQKRTVIELQIDEVGPSLKYAVAKVAKTTRGGNGYPMSDDRRRQQAAKDAERALSDPWAVNAEPDPWAVG